MEVSDQFHAPAGLPQGKTLWYPLDRRLRENQSRSGRGGEEKNSQPLPGLERPIIQPVAQRYTNGLSRLLQSLHIFLLLSLAPQPSLGLGLLHKIRLNFLEASQQFSFLQGRVVSPAPNSHPGGPGLCIYIPQRQGGYQF
jgi:hypothetical protein